MEYSVADYGKMIADSVRMDAYAAALERVVKPGSVVLDIGTGTGIAALIACRLGARRVFAVEPSSVIEVARQAARATASPTASSSSRSCRWTSNCPSSPMSRWPTCAASCRCTRPTWRH